MNHPSNLSQLSARQARFVVQVVNHPEISNATARIGAWMLGTASLLGGFPLTLSHRQIRDGLHRNGQFIPGTGSRAETIRESIAWLENEGLLKSTEGPPSSGGHHTRNYTMV